MEDSAKRSRIVGIVELLAGFLFVIVFGSRIVPGLTGSLPDVTTGKIIAQIVATLIGMGFMFYGLKEYNENSDRALIPLYFWAMVVVGVVAGTIQTIVSVSQDVSNLIIVYEPIAIIAISIPIFFAFRDNKPTLVPLCICFVLLYVIGTVIALIIYLLTGEGYPISTIVLRFIWGVGWLLYFLYSRKLGAVYPKEARVTPKWAKWVVGIYTLLGIAMIILAYIGTIDEGVFRENYTIDEVIAAANQDLPAEQDDGTILNSIELSGKQIIYHYLLPGIGADEIDETAINKYADFLCEQEKFLIANKNAAAVYDYCADGYSVNDVFSDSLGRTIYTYSIVPDDYRQLIEEGYQYRTSDTVFSSLVDYYTSLAPYYLFEGIVAEKIEYLPAENKMRFHLRLPSTDDLNSYSKNYLQSTLSKNWYSLSDELLTLSGFNKIDCEFDVLTSTGLSWTKFTMSPPSAI